MRPQAIIYKSGKSPLQGQVLMHLPPSLRLLYFFMRGIGIGFMILSVSAIIFSYAPILKEEVRYAVAKEPEQQKLTEQNPIIVPADDTGVQEEAKALGLDPNFSIMIPKINAKSSVIPNVNASNKKEYLNALHEGVAHAKGTYFPGQGKQIFLFSHSTDSVFNISKYNAVFYLLNKLEKGDTIVLYNANKKYVYSVEEKVVKSPDDTEFLYTNSDTEILYLMTCTPPGTAWKRLFVIARPVVS